MAKSKAKKPINGGQKKRKKGVVKGRNTSQWTIGFVILLLIAMLVYLYISSVGARLMSTEPSVIELADKRPIENQKKRIRKNSDNVRLSSAKPEEQREFKRIITQQIPEKNVDNAFQSLMSQTCKELQEIYYENEAIPELEYAYASQLISHLGYKTSYNAEYKVPNWVFYELTRAELGGEHKRKNDFAPDPAISVSQRAELVDYRNSGYDRGHLAPAADFSWSETAMSESFYLSNMCPQEHGFNAGIWSQLEAKVREWAARDSAICIASGPVLPPMETTKTFKRIGNGNVLVPTRFYKVVLSPFGKHPKAIAFVMEGHNSKQPLSSFAICVDSLEKLVGMDFFSVLPDDIEARIESEFKIKDWF